MVNSVNIQLIAHYVLVIFIENFDEIRGQTQKLIYKNYSKENSGNIYYTTDLDHSISRSQGSTELPVTFTAPGVRSQNFWRYVPKGLNNIGPFLNDHQNVNYEKRDVPYFNGFFDFVKPLYVKEDQVNLNQPRKQLIIQEPYRYEYPYFYNTHAENILPPPKPIRASIVKLETYSRPLSTPDQIHNISTNTQQYNSKGLEVQQKPTKKKFNLFIDELGFHSNHDMNYTFKPDQTVSAEGTTMKNDFFDNKYNISHRTSSIKIIADNEKKHSINTNEANGSNLHTITPIKKRTGNSITSLNDSNTFFAQSKTVKGNTKLGNDPKASNGSESTNNLTGEELARKSPSTVTPNIINMNIVTGISRNNESKNATQRYIEENKQNITKKTNLKDKSIKIVTNLTLEGLLKNKKHTANIPKYTKYLNMSTLISYELNKLKKNKLIEPRSNQKQEKDVSSSNTFTSFTNIGTNDDELSLDLKILKDTNWDGFTTQRNEPNQSLNSSTDFNDKDIVNKYIQKNIPSVPNTPELNQEEKNPKVINNTMIIVETRVTKSITRKLPLKELILGENTIEMMRRNSKMHKIFTEMCQILKSTDMIQKNNLENRLVNGTSRFKTCSNTTEENRLKISDSKIRGKVNDIYKKTLTNASQMESSNRTRKITNLTYIQNNNTEKIPDSFKPQRSLNFNIHEGFEESKRDPASHIEATQSEVNLNITDTIKRTERRNLSRRKKSKRRRKSKRRHQTGDSKHTTTS